ncbi:uncharacterized protein LOC144389463 [Gasterosteus aculeatus]
MTCEEEPKTCMLKTRGLLSKAQLLMHDIEELLDACTSRDPYNQKQRTMFTELECRASVEEDGETLIIEGLRFESAVSREDLMMLRSPAGRGAEPQQSDGYLSGSIKQSQPGQRTGRGNRGKQRANKRHLLK